MSARLTVRHSAVNLLGFQCCWWLCALAGNWGATGAFVLLLTHLALHPWPRHEAATIVLCGLIGLLADSLLAHSGILAFNTGFGLLPWWLVVLWGCFAATFNQSLAFLKNRLILAALLGGIGGPLTYLAGAELGRVQFGNDTFATMTQLAIVWSLLTPTLVLVSKQLNRPNLELENE